MTGRRGSVLLEALLALVVFMVGTAALVSLAGHSREILTRTEVEARVMPDVVGVPARVDASPAGELERIDGRLRWSPAEGGVRVEFVPTGWDRPMVGWELPRVGEGDLDGEPDGADP